jgi:hypothetical protein
MIATLKRALLLFQIRCQQATIYGQDECLLCVRDPMLHSRILIARHHAKAELARLRAAYRALLPVRRTRIWEAA